VTEAFQIFGSPSSVDLDVVVFVAGVGTIHESSQQCKHFSTALQSKTNTAKTINVNLAVVEGGVISDVFKGTFDELNNALYHTYLNHEQFHPQLVTRLLERDLDMKIVRSVRKLVSCFTRTHLRPKAKQALKEGLVERISFLKTIVFSDIESYGKYGAAPEVHKLIAFTIAQTQALLAGVELYSKEEAGQRYPNLKIYLIRSEDAVITALQNHFEEFIDMLERQELDMIRREE
jgi:hypothetical protein